MQLKQIKYILAFIICYGCSSVSHQMQIVPIEIDKQEYEEGKIIIDFCEYYSGEKISLYIDGSRIFTKRLNTPDDGTGFTYTVTITKKQSPMKMKLFIDGQQWGASIDLDQGHFMCVQYIDSVPYIQQAMYPVYYD